jgi:3-oxoadipate enol-lactonase
VTPIGSLHAVVDGDVHAQPVLVLGPSLGTTTEAWNDLVPLLRETFAIVRFDLPGHGKSPVADAPFTLTDLANAVIALADSLAINTFDYAGVSVSGGVALELAHHFPARLRSTVVICSAAFLGGPDLWRDRIAVIKKRGMDSQLNGLAERWFSPTTIATKPALVDEFLDMVASANPDGYAQVCHAIGTFDARPYLASIRVPTLVISGELDTGTPPSAGKAIADTVPVARQVVFADAAHQAAAEYPSKTATTLVEFLIK